MRYLLTTAATLLFVTPCLAQGLHLPPVEYDKPYPSKITVETVTNAQLRAQCANATQSSLGCAFPGPDRCRILLVDEASIKAVGWTLELILRHERAHCNGWPQSHVGKRPYQPNEGRLP
jgi:hypothetical protein